MWFPIVLLWITIMGFLWGHAYRFVTNTIFRNEHGEGPNLDDPRVWMLMGPELDVWIMIIMAPFLIIVGGLLLWVLIKVFMLFGAIE